MSRRRTRLPFAPDATDAFAVSLKAQTFAVEIRTVDISGLLGDLYESAEKEPATDPVPADQVTDLPARPAEPPLDDEPVTAPLPLAAALDASQRAAQLRMEDAAPLTTPPAAGSEPLLPVTLFHEVHHDDLLPRKSARKSLNISFKR